MTTGEDGAIANNTTGAFKNFVPFVLNSSNSDFVAGINTIQFVVYNNTSGSPNTTGLNVDFESTYAVPEPGSFVLMGLGISALCLGAKKRKLA